MDNNNKTIAAPSFMAYSPFESFTHGDNPVFRYQDKEVFSAQHLSTLWYLGDESYNQVGDYAPANRLSDANLSQSLQQVFNFIDELSEDMMTLSDQGLVHFKRENSEDFIHGEEIKNYFLDTLSPAEALAVIFDILIQTKSPDDLFPGNLPGWSYIAHLCRLYSLEQMLVAIGSADLDRAFHCMNDMNYFVTLVERERRIEDFVQAKARKGAEARHKETKQLKNEVRDLWNKSIDPNLSAEKAAAIVTKHIPITHRTAARYIREVKKEHSASTV